MLLFQAPRGALAQLRVCWTSFRLRPPRGVLSCCETKPERTASARTTFKFLAAVLSWSPRDSPRVLIQFFRCRDVSPVRTARLRFRLGTVRSQTCLRPQPKLPPVARIRSCVRQIAFVVGNCGQLEPGGCLTAPDFFADRDDSVNIRLAAARMPSFSIPGRGRRPRFEPGTTRMRACISGRLFFHELSERQQRSPKQSAAPNVWRSVPLRQPVTLLVCVK